MIKECKILKSNEYMTVVKFGDKDIQLPHTEVASGTIFVAFEKGKYFVVDSKYRDEHIVHRSKKSTIKDVVKQIPVDVLSNE